MRLFLYGTLRDVDLFARVAGPGPGGHAGAAWLDGHAVDRVAASELPMIVARTGARAEGVICEGLSAAQRGRLDLYEVAFGYRVVEVTVGTTGGMVPALVYFPPGEQESSGEAWSLERWQARERQAALFAAEEMDAHDPPLEAGELVRQWPMIASRAQARVRAGRAEPVTRLRHVPGAGDWEWTPARPLAGGFFKLAAMTMAHRRFDGGREQGLRREVLVGVDAALLLPYDPFRDRVMLIEQFRTGPARRGDRNPWTLEPVAGIVDASETPEEAARREAEEEAGLTIRAVEPMFAFYPSPGSNTDYFYCYLGLCDLPDGLATHGGLAVEAEDIRLHVMPRAGALALCDSGEVTAGPLITMIYWLERHAARLRGMA